MLVAAVKLNRTLRRKTAVSTQLLLAAVCGLAGCSLFPETRFRDSLHNPFPQMKRVAVLPFFNQSGEPTVNAEQVAESYYQALQSVPGFEVLPVGVTKSQWFAYSQQYGEPTRGDEFQRFARFLNVEALVVGSVTDFDAYYPPRMGLTVHWYAANEGFHPVPPGYGLPWGTDAEENIPRRIVREAEFELARSQMETQSPLPPAIPETSQYQPVQLSSASVPQGYADGPSPAEAELLPPPPQLGEQRLLEDPLVPETFPPSPTAAPDSIQSIPQGAGIVFDEGGLPLPPDWPNPTDLIPDPPLPSPPTAIVNNEPVLTHTRLYLGDDPYLTDRLADHVETGDDARPTGWRGYLNRSDDFIRFCCHLHVTEMLESRGGRDQSDLILRWPLSRY